jgi:Fe-S cluster assembly protein SufD
MLDGNQHARPSDARGARRRRTARAASCTRGFWTAPRTACSTARSTCAPIAQKTDGKQTNKALLLSDKARVDTKPQLEIFADDVKCTHGATIGRLDEIALFYMKSRGIGRVKRRR